MCEKSNGVIKFVVNVVIKFVVSDFNSLPFLPTYLIFFSTLILSFPLLFTFPNLSISVIWGTAFHGFIQTINETFPDNNHIKQRPHKNLSGLVFKDRDFQIPNKVYTKILLDSFLRTKSTFLTRKNYKFSTCKTESWILSNKTLYMPAHSDMHTR
jgi:hypothetical protein